MPSAPTWSWLFPDSSAMHTSDRLLMIAEGREARSRPAFLPSGTILQLQGVLCHSAVARSTRNLPRAFAG